jgi:hypothetical protein
MARAGGKTGGAAKPDRLKLTGPWEERVSEALKRGRPPADWKPPKRKAVRRKKAK